MTYRRVVVGHEPARRGGGAPVAILGAFLTCCWDDCERYAHDEHQVVEKDRHGPGTMTYLYCSEMHKDYAVHGVRAYGKHSPGHRNPLWVPGRR